ncbi:MAG TPA: hypothetical protein VFG51_00860 [Candidatus Saccharimonadia bacterium]|nr:hypothetical protein [Candidatus Saccharimonadia bacterium]
MPKRYDGAGNLVEDTHPDPNHTIPTVQEVKAAHAKWLKEQEEELKRQRKQGNGPVIENRPPGTR